MPVDSLNLVLAASATAVALAAGWVRRRRDPVLDGERWFKLTLATLIRGEVEATGGDATAWEERVLAEVPYHPAGRLPEQKITNPAAMPPGALLEGEAGLLEALASIEGAEARWRRLYDDDELGIEARLHDPHDLGPTYHPRQIVPSADWDTIARWGHDDVALHEELVRAAGARWVWLGPGEHGRIGPHLQALVPDLVTLAPEPAAELEERLADLLGEGSGPLVLFAEGDEMPALLATMAKFAGLRDRVAAVVGVGANVGGRPDHPDGPLSVAVRKDWLGHWFGQDKLDTSEVRLTPYLALQWLDRSAWPPGAGGLPLDCQRFPEPADQDAPFPTIESVDLGPLPEAGGPPDRVVAKALLFVVSAWVRARQ